MTTNNINYWRQLCLSTVKLENGNIENLSLQVMFFLTLDLKVTNFLTFPWFPRPYFPWLFLISMMVGNPVLHNADGKTLGTDTKFSRIYFRKKKRKKTESTTEQILTCCHTLLSPQNFYKTSNCYLNCLKFQLLW